MISAGHRGRCAGALVERDGGAVIGAYRDPLTARLSCSYRCQPIASNRRPINAIRRIRRSSGDALLWSFVVPPDTRAASFSAQTCTSRGWPSAKTVPKPPVLSGVELRFERECGGKLKDVYRQWSRADGRRLVSTDQAPSSPCRRPSRRADCLADEPVAQDAGPISVVTMTSAVLFDRR
jgi:hypothetical protein